ncbi:TonB-dependent receptor plug domain-containing protein [Sphingomonas solaris]|uniref:TonB-dependent receptor n=1 Tax=Alterirhizorhabdus solaris TaxID=2529389 RepID=A0A558QUW6_9SPHN|nr:TonB-dependent receptor [Sphingomonas solaris]TVV70909.1 TonB-dependent receptor [Sphingomonas solaris]
MTIALILAAAAATAAPAAPDIVVSAALVPVDRAVSPATVTVIDEARIEALGSPFALDLIRLAPGISVATTGSQGAQTQVRIRGAEANHTLVFIDGIAFNDPAAGNEARFETFGADGLGRIEVVRGPQSALWGSEALGGVIALETPDPLGTPRASGALEYGSRDFTRGTASLVTGGETVGVSASAAYLRGDGIDSLGGGRGDRDGFETKTASLKAVARPGADGELGIVARYIEHDNQFDGLDPVTFQRADTAEASRTETGAVRAWATLGRDADAAWSGTIESQYLASDNRNRDGGTPLNRTTGDRFRVGGKLIHRLSLGETRHTLIGALEREDETFRASDTQYFGATDQRRTRGRMTYVGEWRADWNGVLATDVAVRHDDFNRFANETTVRASAILTVAPGLSLVGSYGEGIAQPTFFDLYGFFPGNFVGNANLTPETSRGYEAGVRYTSTLVSAEVTAFSNRLRDEIVSVFDNATFLSSTANATGRSRRRGIEANVEVRPVAGLAVTANYTLIDARDQQVAATATLREVRRPRHSGNLAAGWTSGPLTLGASLAYVGTRRDTDFDAFPALRVRLNDYVLGGARIAYALTPNIEAFGRIENAFDSRYQDAVGYATPGRGVFGGVRVKIGG